MSNDLPKQTNLLKKLIQNPTRCKRNKITSYVRENMNTLDYSQSSKAFFY